MKFRSPKFKRLRVHGVGQFVDGALETDDPTAIAKIEAVADRYDIKAVRDSTDPFDPTAHDRDTVNRYLATASEPERVRVLEAEAAGKARVTILQGSHGVTTGEPVVPPQQMREIHDRAEGEEVFTPVDGESAQD